MTKDGHRCKACQPIMIDLGNGKYRPLEEIEAGLKLLEESKK